MRRSFLVRGPLLAVALTVVGTPVSVFAQTGTPQLIQAPGAQVAQPGQPAQTVRKLTVEEAVKLALEHNLGVQVARVDPQVQDYVVAQARSNWAPVLTSNIATNSISQQPNSALAGGIDVISNDQVNGGVGVQQNLKWGTFYTASWNSSRLTTSNTLASFSPQLRSNFNLQVVQPLLRNFQIDAIRQQVLVGEKNRDVAEIGLQQTISVTSRNTRNAYWNLSYAIASLDVQKQSLELARESLRNNRSRVEIGTMAPIDIVEAEAEVAQREESVILAEAAIERAEDQLRALILDPNQPEFWNTRLEPAEIPPFQPVAINVDEAVRTALDHRTDLRSTRKNIESNDISIRYFRNQSMPDINAQLDYGLSGLGGTQIQRGIGPFGPGTGDVLGQTQRSYSSVLSDLFNNRYPAWTLSLNIGYPIGTSTAEANLARARLQYNQANTQLKNQQLLVATQVRDVGRQVQTNQKRVEATKSSRQLAERRLEAEEKKFQAGMSTSFFVFQAQRDLSQARANELRAITDYNLSIVDYETVQESPLQGGGGVGSVTGSVGTSNTVVSGGNQQSPQQQQQQQ
jgi:outer membrane protein TolC